jgi:hypothetical protein
MTTIGGDDETALKKLKGARLPTSLADTVETQAIGRGTTELISNR